MRHRSALLNNPVFLTEEYRKGTNITTYYAALVKRNLVAILKRFEVRSLKFQDKMSRIPNVGGELRH
ncbi:hypothetical protein NDU88_003760 [Pleurodeles waltl]|uniref:Uncharacterized protein n=1 Tax=Pleurodeles waltl TaxID=8319 RepID=A0AAV7RJ49_PLEWA|nr:hypothetical protein NDU88_003760 [Pleurodeles waltl]